METFNEILNIANNSSNTLWTEAITLLNWANNNATKEDKEAFVEWVENDFENVEKVANHSTTDFFENAPSWETLRQNV